jgi:pSer/pThr/pTyr-binding forkhead associated (FHA) protein
MAYVAPPPQPHIDDEPPTEPPRPVRPRAASRPKSAAWLVDMTTKRQHQLLTGETRLGRKKSANDVVLEDPTVGREHVRIQEVNGHFTLLDLGAQSGTYVNGRRLRGSQLLEDGDEITLGETLLKFKCS